MSLTVVELDEGEPIPAALDEFDFMVVMGGPMDVWQESQYPWMAAEKAAIRRWVSELGRPFLGVCLGHQLLADALGGEVGPMTKPEIGLMEIELTEAGSADPAFGRIPSRFYGLQWHGAQVRQTPSRRSRPRFQRALRDSSSARRALGLGGAVPSRSERGHRVAVVTRARVWGHLGVARSRRRRLARCGRHIAPADHAAPHRQGRLGDRDDHAARAGPSDRSGRSHQVTPSLFDESVLARATAEGRMGEWLEAAGIDSVHVALLDPSGTLREKRLGRRSAARAFERGWSFIDAIGWWGARRRGVAQRRVGASAGQARLRERSTKPLRGELDALPRRFRRPDGRTLTPAPSGPDGRSARRFRAHL